jgi:2-keto-4-pentenoate hydratase/2-oxohepta-3-ene-1,7-dioic acid hydratase in catechol pathway
MPRHATLLNIRTAGGPRLGVKLAKGVLDVAAAAATYKLPAPIDTDDLLQNGKGAMLAALIAAAADGPVGLYLPESAVQHAPLLTRPEKIIMMGFNYRRHAAETGTPIPKNPTLFNKFNNALNHHGGTIVLPTATATQFDHEI